MIDTLAWGVCLETAERTNVRGLLRSCRLAAPWPSGRLTMVSAFLAWLTSLARALPTPRRQEWAFVQPTLWPSWYVGTEEWRSSVWRVATRGPRCVLRP